MKTTLTAALEKGLFGSLAKVNKGKDRKQMLQQIAGEAFTAIDMARGLQGRGDWMGSVAKLADAAGLVIQGVDLAETFPGVKMDQLRKRVDSASTGLAKLEAVVDTKPEECRPMVKGFEDSLIVSAAAVQQFAGTLNDVVMAKEKLEFSEEVLLKETERCVDKMTIRPRPKEEERRTTQQLRSRGLIGGPYITERTAGNWEPVPGKPGRERRKVGEDYEYRDAAQMPATAAKSLVDENSSKIEKPEDEKTETPVTAEKSFDNALEEIQKICSRK